jgi:protein TonB
MFHYRPAATNNRSRMLIAAFLAVAVHMSLMNFEFESKPFSVPSISLPRSVSVFLRQSSIVETPEQPVKKVQDVSPVKEELFKAEKKSEVPVSAKASAIQDKPDNFLQAPPLLGEKTKQPSTIIEEKRKPAVEEIMPAYQKAENATEDVKHEPGEAAEEKEGVILPGTLQMAYPRYQLNTPPTYPGLARKRGQEGTVILQVLVNREGRVDDLKIDTSSNLTLLDRAAVTAVRKWSFEPGRRGEERVPMWVRVPVTFKLKK